MGLSSILCSVGVVLGAKFSVGQCLKISSPLKCTCEGGILQVKGGSEGEMNHFCVEQSCPSVGVCAELSPPVRSGCCASTWSSLAFPEPAE